MAWTYPLLLIFSFLTKFWVCFPSQFHRNFFMSSHPFRFSQQLWFLSVDKSLESQVVSRAYRMGATENVFVEQLVSRHSIEELIVLMNKREQNKHDKLYANVVDLEEFKSEYYEHQRFVTDEKKNNMDSTAKVHYLLSNMKLIRPNHETYRKRNLDISSSNITREKRVRFSDSVARWLDLKEQGS